MKCLLLAAGLGTRLLPLTLSRAKAAVPYQGLPLIAHCIRSLSSFGVEDFAVNLHHLPDSVKRAVTAAGDADVRRIRYSVEPEILGTAGALNPLRSWLGEESFLVVNAKIVFDLDLGEAIARHYESGAMATLVLVNPEGSGAFSPVFVDDAGSVLGFARTGTPAAGTAAVFTGIHILAPRVWRYLPPAGFQDMIQDVYHPALLNGERIGGYRASGTWLEFSTLRRYLDLQKGEGRGPLGSGSSLARSASVTESIVWNDVGIGEGCRLHRCIVADGARVPDGACFDNAALVPAHLATPRFQPYVQNGLIAYPLESMC